MDPLGVLIGPVEYSTVPKVLKICQMTFNLHFDEKIIMIRSVVMKIYAFKIFEKAHYSVLLTPFTAIRRNMYTCFQPNLRLKWVTLADFASLMYPSIFRISSRFCARKS